MRTLNNDGTLGPETAHPLDTYYQPRARFGRTYLHQADGTHFFCQLPGGKTTLHVLVPVELNWARVEAADGRFVRPPKKLNAKTQEGTA